MRSAASKPPTAGAMARRNPSIASLVPIAAALLGVTLLAAGSPARAQDYGNDSWRPRPISNFETWADGRLVDVQLKVDGDPAPLYVAPGHDDRHYFQAFAGRNYSVLLKNNSGRRVAVLLAVDGLNAVNGEITALRPDEGMYVLGPWEQATIRGWRTSLNEVRRFVFVDERRSYAERTGQSNSDMGWIRVLSFREQTPWWHSRRSGWDQPKARFRDDGPQANVPAPVPMNEVPQARAEDSKDGAPAPTTKSVAPEAQDNLTHGEQGQGGSFPGTGWGERKQDRVQRTQFTPDPVAVDHLIFRYEYASGLQALGILPARRFRDRLGERDGEMGFARPPR
ncbi:MAG TPA: hypothetical protein VI504_02510 [Candidatus Eisenbacteria bacterium]